VNTAVDSEMAILSCERGLGGLSPGCWIISNRLPEEGRKRSEVRSDVDSAKLATLIAALSKEA